MDLRARVFCFVTLNLFQGPCHVRVRMVNHEKWVLNQVQDDGSGIG
jgi:sensor histidine kinase YesM